MIKCTLVLDGISYFLKNTYFPRKFEMLCSDFVFSILKARPEEITLRLEVGNKVEHFLDEKSGYCFCMYKKYGLIDEDGEYICLHTDARMWLDRYMSKQKGSQFTVWIEKKT